MTETESDVPQENQIVIGIDILGLQPEMTETDRDREQRPARDEIVIGIEIDGLQSEKTQTESNVPRENEIVLGIEIHGLQPEMTQTESNVPRENQVVEMINIGISCERTRRCRAACSQTLSALTPTQFATADWHMACGSLHDVSHCSFCNSFKKISPYCIRISAFPNE